MPGRWVCQAAFAEIGRIPRRDRFVEPGGRLLAASAGPDSLVPTADFRMTEAILPCALNPASILGRGGDRHDSAVPQCGPGGCHVL